MTPPEDVSVELTVNGEQVSVRVPPRRLLADVLREDLELTGTHLGCEHGICGACTVLIDGLPARSCTTLAVQVAGGEVTTIEGLTPSTGLSPMQAAFKQCHGLQCGFCTPGFLVTLSAADPADHPDDESIREALAGNICRCTGYQQIVEAVRVGWGRDPA
jgi:carbon-monoxide dehydrogenase small subunit